MERFLESDDRLRSTFCLALREREEVGELRRVGKTGPRFDEECLRALTLPERADEQLRETEVGLSRELG